uniref:PDZ domain-containing protein n=1 Tax=Macrostomum lignano TaxID=282301 RepID=A0A1I8HGQ2_9PLAT
SVSPRICSSSSSLRDAMQLVCKVARALATTALIIAILPYEARAQDVSPGVAAGVTFAVTFIVCVCVCVILVCYLLRRMRLMKRRSSSHRSRSGVENTGFDWVENRPATTGRRAEQGGGASVRMVNEQDSAKVHVNKPKSEVKDLISVRATKLEDLELKIKLSNNMVLVSKDPAHSSLCSRQGVRAGDRIVAIRVDLTAGEAADAVDPEHVSFLLGLAGCYGLTVEFQHRQPATSAAAAAAAAAAPPLPPSTPLREASRSVALPSIVVSEEAPAPAPTGGPRLLLARGGGVPQAAAGGQLERALLNSDWAEAEPQEDEWVALSVDLMLKEEADSHAYAVIGEVAVPNLDLSLEPGDEGKTWRSLGGAVEDALTESAGRRGSASSGGTSSGTANTLVEMPRPRSDDSLSASGDDDLDEADLVVQAVRNADKALSNAESAEVEPEVEIDVEEKFEAAVDFATHAEVEFNGEVEVGLRPEADVELELDFESQPEVEAEVKFDVDVRPEVDAEVELDANLRTEFEAEVEFGVDIRPEVDAELELDVDVRQEAEVEFDVDGRPEVEAEVEFNVDGRPEVEAEVEFDVDGRPEVEAEVEFDVDGRPEVETEVEFGVDVRPGAEVEFGVDVQPEAEVEFGVDVRPEAEVEFGVDVRPEAEVEFGVDVRPEAEVEFGVDVGPEVEVEIDADAEVERESEEEIGSDIGIKSGAEVDLDVQAEAEVDLDVQAEAEVDLDVQAEAEVDLDVQAEAEVDLDVQAEAEVDLDVQAEAEVDLDVQAEAEVDLDVQAEAEVDLDAQAELDSDAEEIIEAAVSSVAQSAQSINLERKASKPEVRIEAPEIKEDIDELQRDDDIEEVSIDDDTPDVRSLDASAPARWVGRAESSGSCSSNESIDDNSDGEAGSDRRLRKAIRQAARAVEKDAEDGEAAAASRKTPNSAREKAAEWQIQEPELAASIVQHPKPQQKASRIPQRSLSSILRDVESATVDLVNSEAQAAAEDNHGGAESSPVIDETDIKATQAPVPVVQLDFQALQEAEDEAGGPESPLLDPELVREIQAGAEGIWDDDEENGVEEGDALQLEESEGELSDSFQELLNNEELLEQDGFSRSDR